VVATAGTSCQTHASGAGATASTAAVLPGITAAPPGAVGSSASSTRTRDVDPAVPGPWHLVFDDRFTGHTLDPAHWVTCYDWNVDGCTNGAAENHELEWYLPSQVGVRDGVLTLTARRRTVRGSTGLTYPWVSGMVSTGRQSWNATPHVTFTYGYAEAVIRLPAERGMFPAFWLMPAATKQTPPEIDIVEKIRAGTQVGVNVHWLAPGGAAIEYGTKYDVPGNATTYHSYAVDWEPDRLAWYIDGVAVRVVTNPVEIPTVAMELLVTLAVGFPVAPPDTVSSASMEVSSVRIWQH
jgi:beta-glucanase (GH16 family)